jgi:hypothetical protein
VVKSDNSVAFHVASYDPTKPLVIDPTLAYSTYLSGSGGAAGVAIAVDASGNAYVAGTAGADFPITPGAFQPTCCGALVSKLNAAGSALLYSTYLGGSGQEFAGGIAVDASGNARVPSKPLTPAARAMPLSAS